MREIELKDLIDDNAAWQLWPRARASGLANGKPTTRTLRSIYLDTPDHDLRAAGIALRLRRDGRRWVQTVKTGREMHGGLSQAEELENPAPGGRVNLDAIPDPSVRDAVRERVNGAQLRTICETVIRRTAGELSLGDGTRAELAVDVGEIRAEGRSAALREAEIELIDGSPGKLFDIARALFPEGDLRFSRLSKSARGYLLAKEGHIDPPLAPRYALPVSLEPEQTTEQAARDVLRECVEQIAMNVTVVIHLDDLEGPHQLRVGLRRLRSAFSIFSPVLKSPEMERLGQEACWLGQAVGAVRDLDVTGEIARREATVHPDEAGLAGLAHALERNAAAQRERLRAVLAAERVRVLLLDLVRFTETRGWLMREDFEQTARLATPVAAFAEAALGKRWKKARKRARGLETLAIEQRHELRKELKKLRYAVEFMAPLYSQRRAQAFLKRMKKLQTVLGELNDAALVRSMLAEAGLAQAGEAVSERAIGWVMGASQARAESAWVGAKALWKDVEKGKTFWR